MAFRANSFKFLWRTVNSKPPTMPFGIVAYTFSDNLSRNSCIPFSLTPSLIHLEKINSCWCWLLAVDVRILNVRLEIFKVLIKEGEFTCFDDILAKIKQLSEAEKCMITEIITRCKLLLVNPATSAAGERSFSSARRLKTWLRSTMTQTRFSNLTILNTHKQRTDKLCLIDVANEFAALNENRKSNFGTFKESDLKMSGWHSSVTSVGFSLEVSLFI